MAKSKALVLKGEVQINGSVNVRTEKHGDENHTAMDIKCQMMISRPDLQRLLREELAVAALFNEKAQGHYEPLFGGKIGPIPVVGRFECVGVDFTCGVNSAVIGFKDCTVKNVTIDPQVGGMTHMKFTVATLIDETGKALLDFAGTSQKITMKLGDITIAKEDQMALPMGDGDPEQASKVDARLDEMLREDGAAPAKTERA